MTTTETTAFPDPKKAEPRKEHQWLTRLVGEWTFEGETLMGPGQPPEKFHGTESVRALGELWILVQGEGEVPGTGTQAATMMTLGYDPQKERFVGTFIGTMMTNLWLYEGSLDAGGKVLSLDAEGPGMSGDGSMAKYRDTIEIESEDERRMTSSVLGDDGSWTTFMRMTIRRARCQSYGSAVERLSVTVPSLQCAALWSAVAASHRFPTARSWRGCENLRASAFVTRGSEAAAPLTVVRFRSRAAGVRWPRATASNTPFMARV